MKKILFLALALIAFASCSKEDAIENESIEGKEYVVNLQEIQRFQLCALRIRIV